MTDPESPASESITRACEAWTSVFTGLSENGVPSMDLLEDLTTEDVRFRDPFNDVRGRPALRFLLQHTVRQVEAPCFEVLDTAVSGRTAYVKWRMTGRVAIIGDWEVTGMSELEFAADGRLKAHLDYWDSAGGFYAQLPVLGPVIRFLASRAAVPES